MYKLFLTLRYLRSRVISYVAAAVLALMVAILIVVTSVMGGFQREFHNKIRGTLADVTVEAIEYFGIRDAEVLSETVEKVPHVEASAPYIERIVLLDTTLRSDYGFLTGIDPVREVVVGEIETYVLSPREIFDLEHERLPKEIRESAEVLARRLTFPDEKPDVTVLLAETRSGLPGVLVGAQLYSYLELRLPGLDLDGQPSPGDLVTLLSTGATAAFEELREDHKREAQFEVVGVFETGMFEQDRRLIYGGLAAVQSFLGIEQRISGLNLKLDDYHHADVVTELLKDKLQDRFVAVLPWDKRNANLIKAVAIERFLVYFIVLAMMILAGLCLSAIMTMSVVEKTKDLGILGAIGATRWGRFSIFLWQGGLIGLFGSLLGTGLGLTFIKNINWIDLNVVAPINGGRRVFDPSIYYLDKIPADVDPTTILVCVVPTILIGFLLSLYPAYRAARLEPIQALRYE